jgi:magnesium chelatase family protein
MGQDAAEFSSAIRDRVEEARARQRDRYELSGIGSNADLPGPRARREVRLSAEAERLLSHAVDRLELTGRGFDRALKVARTVADLSASERVESAHLAEALSYRATPSEAESVGAALA